MRRMGLERADAAEGACSLYDIAANRLNDATEPAAYNSLISAWSELTVQAANMTDQMSQAMPRADCCKRRQSWQKHHGNMSLKAWITA